MKTVMVTVKRAVDYNVNIQVKADHSGVMMEDVKMSMNPFCEIAVEAAIGLKEKQLAEEILLVSIGPEPAEEQLRQGLAMGADRAILVVTTHCPEPLMVAQILKQIAQSEAVDLVIMGKQSIDTDHNQAGQMLGALLDWPQATFASEMSLQDEMLQVTREIDGGLETIAVTLPAVVTTDLRLNEPRYPSLPNIIQSKNKPIQKIPVDDYSFDRSQHLEYLRVDEPPVRTGGVVVEDVDEFVKLIKDEGVFS